MTNKASCKNRGSSALDQEINARIDWYKNKSVKHKKVKKWDKDYNEYAPRQAKLLSPTLRYMAKDTNIELIPSKIMLFLFEYDQYGDLKRRMKRSIKNKMYIINYENDENLIKLMEYGILPCGHSGETTAKIIFVY